VDGPWVPQVDESSIYTVVIYLNDDYDGGATNFRSEGTTLDHMSQMPSVRASLLGVFDMMV
jgi:hypothetical protein